MKDRLLKLADELGGPLLAIDTSAAAALCRVAWAEGEVVEESFATQAQQSEAVGSAIAVASAAHPNAVKQLKAIVVGLGPGSFTGLRVGLALAKGMAYAGDIPLYGVSSMATLAASQEPGLVALTLEARKGEIFAAVYDVGEGIARPVVGDLLTTPAGFESIQAAHPNARVLNDARIAPIKAGMSLLIAADRMRHGQRDDVSALVPSYLKVSEPERKIGV